MTVPMVKRAVIMAVCMKASGSMPAMGTLRIYTTVTEIACQGRRTRKLPEGINMRDV